MPTIRVLLVVVAALAVSLPYLWTFSASLRPSRDVFLATGWGLLPPLNPSLENYITAISRVPMLRWFVNSVVFSVGELVGQIGMGALAAFGFVRYEFPGRGFFFGLILATMMIPAVALIVPLFLVINALDWVDTYQGLIIPRLGLTVGFATFLLRQTFLTIPRELDDAQAVDGANALQRFWHLYIPLSRPALAAAGIIGFVHSWNEFTWPYIVTFSDSIRTLPVGAQKFVADGLREWGPSMAYAVMLTLPVVAIYIVFQRAFAQGFISSGIRG
jgi:ABC-type glycerol-3-phosphate transport system permease component